MTELSSTAGQTVVQPSATQNSGLVQISQDALNGLLGSTKREATEKERSRLEAEFEAKAEKIREEAGKKAAEIAKTEAQREVREMRKQELDEANEKQISAAQQQIKDKLLPKFEEGKTKFSDWNDTVGSYEWNKPEFAEILPLLAQDGIDNPEEVLRDLCASGDIVKLTHRNKAFIMNELKRASESLKTEKDKSQLNVLPEPIKPLKPSHVKTKGDGDQTIEDFRKARWLRG